MSNKEHRIVVVVSASVKKTYDKKCRDCDTDMSKKTRELVKRFIKHGDGSRKAKN